MAIGNSIKDCLEHLEQSKQKLKGKVSLPVAEGGFGQSSLASASLDTMVEYVKTIPTHSGQNKKLTVGETLEISAGWYPETFSVTAPEGDEELQLQAIQNFELTEAHLKRGASIQESEGYHGIASITFAPREDLFTYEQASENLESAHVLTGYYAVNGKNEIVEGKMPNNGKSELTINKKDDTLTIPQGYHNGSGYCSISSNEQAKLVANNIRQGVTILGVTGTMSATEGLNAHVGTCTPTKSVQNIVPEPGYNALSSVIVAAIPAEYQDVTGVTATAETVLEGKAFVGLSGEPIPGTMTDNSKNPATVTLNTTNKTTYTVPAGFHGSGDKATKVQISVETATKTLGNQSGSQGGSVNITPSANGVLGEVNVSIDKYLTTQQTISTIDGLDVTSVEFNTGYHTIAPKAVFNAQPILEALQAI